MLSKTIILIRNALLRCGDASDFNERKVVKRERYNVQALRTALLHGSIDDQKPAPVIQSDNERDNIVRHSGLIILLLAWVE